MRRALFALTVTAFAITGSSACATKKFVNTRVGEVDGKVTTVSGELEKSQQRISEVDQKAGAAGEAARAADAKAAAAGESATTARTAADAAGKRAEALDAAGRRLVYEVVLNEAKGGFKFNKVDLPDDAKAALDKVITDLQADPKGVFFEIEGHTDNVGGPKYNESLGMQRAEAVKRYLYEAHQVPLHKINVISYGEQKPVSSNKTRVGRSENRRIVVRMLS
ncbi:MAG: OmpA family protein [Luteitalea sp.]|nr:OmpA family protein [Acidobacteriota bacterium]